MHVLASFPGSPHWRRERLGTRLAMFFLCCLLHKWRGRLSVTNLSSEIHFANVSTDCSRAKITFTLMTTGAFSQNVSKVLKLLTDKLPLHLCMFCCTESWKSWPYHIHTHVKKINVPKKGGLDVMQNHTMCRTHQALSAVGDWESGSLV